MSSFNRMSVTPSSISLPRHCAIRSQTSFIRLLALCGSTSIHLLCVEGLVERTEALLSVSTPGEMIIEGAEVRTEGWALMLPSLSSGDISDLFRRDDFRIRGGSSTARGCVGDVCGSKND
jgi:hypothetical protein